MQWVMVRSNGAETAGLVLDGSVHLLESGTRLIDLLGDDGQRLHEAAHRATEDPSDITDYATSELGPPLVPPQLRDFLTFLGHLKNARGVTDDQLDPGWHQIPTFYFSNTASIVGPRDPVHISPGAQNFDYELEVAAIIGREGSNLHPDEAEAHIAGYMIFNDWSARDVQRHEQALNLGPAKGKDSASTLGPLFVSADELAPYRRGNSFGLEMRGYVNGELLSRGSMDEMNWSFGEMVAYASRGTRVVPGDAICSGTVPTGCLLELRNTAAEGHQPSWLQPGDVVRLEIDHLGATEQRVLAAPETPRLRTGF